MGLIFSFFSCGSHVVISPLACENDDYLNFYRAEGRWFTHDLKSTEVKANQFKYTEQTHSFFGTKLSSKQGVHPCEMLQHQKAKNITIESKFSLQDVLWGLIPGYSPRTVTLRGEYDI